MALKPCRECGKQVSDQADVCPNCGIKEPTISVETASPSQPGEDSDVILTMPGILITRTLAKFPSQTFPINGIGSVTVATANGVLWFIGAAVFLVSGIAVIGSSVDGNPIGIFPILGAFALFIVALKQKDGLLIKTSSGDVRAMVGDKKKLEIVKQAIERAATMRG